MLRRTRHDRDILRYAALALPALAAEPTYLLADTAIVGHLGTRELAALALAAAVLTALVALCNFLTYATTAQVARLHGAGEAARAAAVGPQALFLAAGLGVLLALACVAFAEPAVRLLGGEGATADAAARYLRLSAAGLPCALIALAGQGWLRGVGDLRTPLLVVVAGNAVNVVLEVVLVYGLDLGLDGSALGTVAAQLGMAGAFVVLLLRGAPTRRPDVRAIAGLARVGGHLLVRTASLLASFTLATAVVADAGEPSLAAHQIAFQLFVFLALVLDAFAIAGQVLVGRMLGAGDAAEARVVAWRLSVLSAAAGGLLALALLAGTDLVPRAFTSDDAVLDRAADLWPLFAALQVTGAVAFALDGVLIGAGDSRFLAWAMAASTAVFVPAVLLAGDGVVGVWLALHAFMLARVLTTGARFLGGRWAVTGAVAG